MLMIIPCLIALSSLEHHGSDGDDDLARSPPFDGQFWGALAQT